MKWISGLPSPPMRTSSKRRARSISAITSATPSCACCARSAGCPRRTEDSRTLLFPSPALRGRGISRVRGTYRLRAHGCEPRDSVGMEAPSGEVAYRDEQHEHDALRDLE